jgi:hypothetical protein
MGGGPPSGRWHRFPQRHDRDTDNSTLIVAEFYGKKLTAFDIATDGGCRTDDYGAISLEQCRTALDAENAIWYADVRNKCCVRVREGVKYCKPSLSIAAASLARSEART